MSKATVLDPIGGSASARGERAPRRNTGSRPDISDPRGVAFLEAVAASCGCSPSAEAIRWR